MSREAEEACGTGEPAIAPGEAGPPVTPAAAPPPVPLVITDADAGAGLSFRESFERDPLALALALLVALPANRLTCVEAKNALPGLEKPNSASTLLLLAGLPAIEPALATVLEGVPTFTATDPDQDPDPLALSLLRDVSGP